MERSVGSTDLVPGTVSRAGGGRATAAMGGRAGRRAGAWPPPAAPAAGGFISLPGSREGLTKRYSR